jgi:glucokinase
VDHLAVLAIDIGGTKMAAAVVDPFGTMHGASRTPTPRADDPEELFAAVATVADAAVRRWAGDAPIAAVGVGCGGPMAPGGVTVTPLNIPGWRAFPLRARLAGRYGAPAFVDNDAKALTRAEGWLGAAVGRRDYLAMVVSTGVGAGLVVDGRLLDGASGNAGHLGHVVVEPDGRPCGCGGRGCLEAEASGTAIAAVTGRPAAEAPEEVRRRTGRLVGRAVASAVALLDIRLAVVGGSVALGFGASFLDAANEELAARCAIEFGRGARIVPAGLGADGPVVGAAAVGFEGLGLGVGGPVRGARNG